MVVLGGLLATCAVICPRPAWSYMYEIEILETKAVRQLVDEKLIDAYMDVLVELEAARSFHATSSFTPKEYKAFKDLLKYRLILLMEIHGRNLEIPSQLER